MINKKKDWQEKILNWYYVNKRNLPWRKKTSQNFYSIWLSEIMLQQTMVKTVIPYYLRFKKKWPNLESFFSASIDEILFLWQGMGFYRRAINMHKTVQILKKKKLKNISYNSLMELPGVGDYTASMITAILNDNNKAVIDGNIKRIISRAFNVNMASKNFLKKIRQKAQEFTPVSGNKDYCQALMDLGAVICRPKNPKCSMCPVIKLCSFPKNKNQIAINPKKEKITKYGAVFFISSNKSIFIQRSNDKFLEGLMKFPSTEFLIFNNHANFKKILGSFINNWLVNNISESEHQNLGMISHKFSHFDLNLYVVKVKIKRKKIILLNGIWIQEKRFKNYAFSKLMVKVNEKVKENNEYFN